MAKQPYTEETEIPLGEAADELPEEELHHETDAQKPVRQWYLGSNMGKRILGVVVVLVVLYLLWYAYRRHAAQAGDGSVKFDDTTALTEESATPSSSSNATTTATDTSKTKNIVLPTTNVQPALTGTVAAPPPAASAPAVAAPATDSIPANPANGATFSGSGKYQVYRQGNLTWRVDTESGRTCILFATMEEWRKPVVYQHGCSNS